MTRKSLLVGSAAALALVVTACGEKPDAANAEAAAEAPAEEANLPEISVSDAELEGNPFRQEWDTPYGVPPFAEIEDAHYMPATKKAILELRADIDAIVSNPEEPDFENTIVALDTAGASLNRVLGVFSNITNTDTNDTLSELEAEIWPMLTRETDAISFNDALFTRVKAVYDQRDRLGLDEQDARLLELTHREFVRNGAALSPEVKAEVAAINEELSGLTTKFGRNLLLSTKAFKIEITDEAELAGLSDDFKSALKVDGEDKWILTVDRSVYETFMTQSENRELREKMFDGYRLRASEGEYDNGPLAIKIAQLRAKRAELMGYKSHAHYQLEPRMAKTPKGAEEFLLKVWEPGLERAKEERAAMQEMVGDEFQIAGHDWWHYAEKVRQDLYAFDDNALKPYFELGAVRQGAFDVASRLFDITLEPVEVDGWNPVVTAYDVKDANTGEHLGLFMMDMYARDSKRGGAWMSSYRNTSNINGDNIRPIITNNLNLITPAEGEPTLMRFDEVETLFHEFGHGLHGLLTQIRYSTFSGVDGPRDYTEFPAQILEHWAGAPEVLAEYANHYETGEPIPMELIDKMNAAATFNQGFKTTEFIAASLLDLRWHMLTSEEAAEITDAREFERKVLEEYGLLPEIEPRYRSQYFSHIFAGGYSAGYYAYLWSEILDADGFTAFRETGDIYDPELAARLKKWVYEAGGLREADELYRNFRGSDPTIEPLLKLRGFAEQPSEG
ncbi:MAG: peptidyl-dipeptidase [Hyphomonas sp.]|uniref:M3 family metallopeptidase n=1 Tax=unclassified Hyphomonas TaxID=2630699 RepID=UPI000B70ED5E|nr:M3 family metallopeptidase [Hyphomonas sp.]MAH93074.1 peptidyl-dipeptidase [Hyphomonas sp.]OUX86483.1 MAG: peptidyl-dipeptidase [Hyphomonas sp. TMED31]HBH44887.1 M3 family peptidase [Hyphomonas atlantica]